MKVVARITGQRVAEGKHWIAYRIDGAKDEQLAVVLNDVAEQQLADHSPYVGQRARLNLVREFAPVKGITGFSFKPENVGPDPEGKGCTAPKKRRYVTQSAAVGALDHILRMNRNNNRRMPTRAYLCPGCGFWHLTSRPEIRRSAS